MKFRRSHAAQSFVNHVINLIGDEPLAALSKKKKAFIKPANGMMQIIKQRQPSRKALLAFAERTLGLWADDANIERAFAELEKRWQEWREETLK